MRGYLKNILKNCRISVLSQPAEKEKTKYSVNHVEPNLESLNNSTAKFNGNFRDDFSAAEDWDSSVAMVRSKLQCSKFAIILITLVFILLPLVYILYFFAVLHSQWPKGQYQHVLRNHSSSNLRKDLSVLRVRHQSNHHIYGMSSVQCSNISDEMKFDCFPEAGATELSCQKRGCCWFPKKLINSVINSSVNIGVPFCFYPLDFGGYKFINISETSSGLTAFLQRMFKSPYPDDIGIVRMDFMFENQHRLHVKLLDPNVQRFEPPYPQVPQVKRSTDVQDYKIELDNNKVGFKVIRRNTNTTIFNCQNVGAFIFADQFLQLSSLLPSDNIYGLGEHRSTFRLSTHWERFVQFNHDVAPTENVNLYGSHPFYLVMENDGNSHGTFLLNSNAMEVILQPAPAITFRTIGGILDFYFFLGPTPADVIRQYTDVIGKPYMPPYWGLGFHLCRFGYKTLNHTKEVWNRTRTAGIPLDVQWNDLDYMDSNNDFTYDKVKYEGLPQFVEELHELDMHYVLLIDPGISAGEKPGTYPPYDYGISLDIFIKNSTGQPFVGKVWNRVSTVWPDFTHPRAVDYWMLELQNFHSEVPFDGAWIDMNEPSNFYSGSATGCPHSNLDYPPYVPAVDGQQIFYKTLCMSCLQRDGVHYDMHNLYGFTEAIVTNFVMTEVRHKRPFVISRSTFPGHGHFAGHWSGDDWSDWHSMKRSISQLLSFSLFGIPLMGSDICGFNGNTTVALCQRWMQLGAFYPFSRNHNTDDGIPQDPVALGPEVVEAARRALLMRYSLLPYLYTLFWKAHVDGDTVARPLFFEFPMDSETYGVDAQFLWGPALMIIPVLEEGKTSVLAYLPQSLWYSIHTLTLVADGGSSEWSIIPAPLDTIPLLVRGGYILPMQVPGLTTVASRKNPLELIVAANKDGEASGNLYWDDGDTINTYEIERYNLLNFTLRDSQLWSQVTWWGYDEPLLLNKISVLGVSTAVKSVYVNKISCPFSYNTSSKFLIVENLDLHLKETFTIFWQ